MASRFVARPRALAVNTPARTYSLGVSQYHQPDLLNDCVRNGNRCGQIGICTGMNLQECGHQRLIELRPFGRVLERGICAAPRAASAARASEEM